MSTESQRTRILIVEDEVLVAMDLSDQLEELGFEVVGPAARIEDALALMAEQAVIDLALIDVNLSGRLSWPVARELKRRGVGFAFVTGYEASQANIPEDLRGIPVCPKPMDPAHLLHCIQQARESENGR